MTYPEQRLREFLRPTDPLPIAEWGARNYVLDKSSMVVGNFSITHAPWLAQPLTDFQNPDVTSVFLMLGLQLGKTTAGGLTLGWCACEDPGPALWYHSDAQLLKSFVEQRLMDSWQRSPVIKRLLPDDHKLSWKSINFATMAVNFLTVGSTANLTGNPARYVFGDEIKDWDSGVWSVVKKRTAAWVGLSKCFGFSTPKDTDDDVDTAFREGSQHRYFFECPMCKESQEFDFFKAVEWDRHIDERGAYDMPKIVDSARMECVKCRAVLAEAKDPAREVQSRMALLRGAQWVQTNTSPTAGHRSYTCQSLANPRVPLSVLVTEYLKAKEAERLGVLQPLQDFYNQRGSRPWGMVEEGEGLENIEEFQPGEWAEEKARFTTVDVQTMDVLYAQCWQWSEDGRARFVSCAKLDGFPGLRHYQTENNVKDRLVFLDIRFNATAVKIECHRWGWRALSGEDKDSFAWYRKRLDGTTEIVHRIVSPAITVDPGQGTNRQGKMGTIEMRRWSNLHCKDILARMIRDKRFVIPDGVDPEYTRQLKSERKERTGGGKWRWVKFRDNHYWDGAAMQVAVAMLAGLVKMDFQKAENC